MVEGRYVLDVVTEVDGDSKVTKLKTRVETQRASISNAGGVHSSI